MTSNAATQKAWMPLEASGMTERDPGPCRSATRPHLVIWTDVAALGGVAAFNHAMSVGMRQRGYDVTVVAPEFNDAQRDIERQAGIKHREAGLPERQSRGPAITDEAATTALLGDLAPDVILFSDGSAISNLLAKKCASKLSVPMVFSVGIVLQQHAEIARQWPEFQKIYEAAHSVVVVSRHNAQLLSRFYPIGRCEPILIHYGRPDAFFKPVDEAHRRKYRAEVNAGPDDLLFLTVARYDLIKGFDFLLRALERLRKESIWSRLHFVWIGEGPLEEQLRHTANALGIASQVHLLGSRNDVDRWLDATDAFILPSRAEGMPLCLSEAMAKGVPVIATPAGGIPEQVEGHAILINPGTPDNAEQAIADGIFQAVRWIAQHPEQARELGRLGKIRAERLFREERMVLDYARLIGAAIRPSPGIGNAH